MICTKLLSKQEEREENGILSKETVVVITVQYHTVLVFNHGRGRNLNFVFCFMLSTVLSYLYTFTITVQEKKKVPVPIDSSIKALHCCPR